MLKITKSINLQGQSLIDGETAISLNANISQDGVGSTSINQNVMNSKLYTENKKECRNDSQQFQEAVWKVEDQLALEQEPIKK